VLLVILISGTTTAVLLLAAYFIHPILGCALEAWLTFRLLATKSLRDASMNVYRALTEEDSTLENARYAVSMIVGRDTAVLDEIGVTKAAVETVAENTSDGIIAPMLYTAIGGPILGIIYKSINTMDSMVAYRNEKYIDFGRAAALTDDFANFLPARISGVLMIAATGILGLMQKLCREDDDEYPQNDTFHYSASNALRILRRDRRKHASPNAAHTEAVCAGALSIELAGDASYFGEIHHKPTLGDPIRPIESEDIIRANRLMLGTAIICEFLCLAVMALILIFRN
jgi:adenosylcobinamide-phosphate synthase